MLRKKRSERRATSEERRGGFTLIEVLLAVMLTSIVIGGMAALYDGARKLREGANQKTTNYQTARGVFESIATDLFGMYYSETSSLKPTFTGTTTQVSFYTVSSQKVDALSGVTLPILAQVTYKLEDEKVKKDVTVPFVNAAQSSEIASDVASLEFEFIDGTTSQQSWDSSQTSTLPVIVKVKIKLKADENYVFENSVMLVQGKWNGK